MAGVESKVAEAKTTAKTKTTTATEATAERPTHRGARADYRWDGVEERPYKEDDRALFKSITRQVLFSDPEMHAELRYFEVAAGGFSTLERHQHMHAVLILRGRGHCLIGGEVKSLETRDLVTVPPLTWHQFRASKGEPLGFLCMVNALRDKPQLPGAEDLARLTADPLVAEFLRGEIKTI
jgi:mannose-6-phosphate isomerase-like protein (cupin superfamily)